MAKKTARGAYLTLCGTWLIVTACYIALFLLAVALQERSDIVFSVACYYLFPVFSVIYGILSYKLSHRIVGPNLLYILFAFFTWLWLSLVSVLTSVLNDPYWAGSSAISPFWSKAIDEFPIFALFTILSVAASAVIAIVSSVLTMAAMKILHKLRKRNL